MIADFHFIPRQTGFRSGNTHSSRGTCFQPNLTTSIHQGINLRESLKGVQGVKFLHFTTEMCTRDGIVALQSKFRFIFSVCVERSHIP